MKNLEFFRSFLLTIVFSVLVWSGNGFAAENRNQVESDEIVSVDAKNTVPTKPIIIWYSRQWGWGRFEPLKLATSSGIFSHVLLTGLHEYDVPDYEKVSDRFAKALRICRDNGVEVIWTRFLYPGHKIGDFTIKDAFDPNYYIEQLNNIKSEAIKAGIKLVAFDMEPYTNCPLKPYKDNSFSEVDYKKLVRAIDKAIEVAGKVDYVLPSAAAKERHLYNATVKLGREIITESTYYDIPIVHQKNPDTNRPYDIFGAYVGVTTKHPKKPYLKLYTPRDILERQYLWAHKKGLFIYAGNAAPEVAHEFWKIKQVVPIIEHP